MNFLANIFRRKRKTRLEAALEHMDGATERFRIAAEMSVQPHARLFWDLAAASVGLRAQVVSDPGCISSLRRIIFFYLPTMSDLCHRWARLSQADPLRPPDETAIADFRGYLELIQVASDACRMRHYDDLHLTMEAFDEQLQRLSV